MPPNAEPGYYQDGEFGIRIEDVMCSVEAETEVSYYYTTRPLKEIKEQCINIVFYVCLIIIYD